MVPWIKQVVSVGSICVNVVYVSACTYEPPNITSTGGAGGTGGILPTNEINCLDGLDDDGDDLVDCADPDCDPGYECVADAPFGFGEYARIVVGPSGENAPPCPLETEKPVTRGESVSVPECTKCDCTSDAKCENGKVHIFSTMDCTGSEQTLATPTDCLAIPPQVDTRFYNISTPTVVGKCVPTTAMTTPKSPWSKVVHACGAFNTSGKGCGEGRFCIPRSASPYLPSICIQASGNHDCSGEYSRKVLAFDGAQDDRSCSECTCSADLECTGYMVALHDTADCMSNNAQSGSYDCTTLPNTVGSMKFSTPAPQVTNKVCQGGVAAGNVVPQNSRTFCCTE